MTRPNKKATLPTFTATASDIKRRMVESDPSNVAVLEIYGGAFVGSGTFPYFPSSTSVAQEGLKVAQLIDIKEKRDIVASERIAMHVLQESRRHTRSSLGRNAANFVEGFIAETDRTKYILLRTMQVVHDSVRPPRDKFDNVSDATKEVVMTCTLKWFPLERISSCAAIAFVHHLQSIQDGDWPCSGQFNTFFIQQCRTDSGGMEVINQAKFNPFYSPHSLSAEPYAMRISNFLTSLTEKCFKLLTGSKATYDSRSKHLHLPGSNFECYQYIEAMVSLHLKEAIMTPQRSHWSSQRARKELHSDLSVSNKRRKIVTDLRRYTLSSQLRSLRLVLGSTFGIGPLLSVPTMKDIKSGKYSSTVRLRTTDDVRIVSCIEDDDAIEYDPGITLRKRLDHEGVDLKFHRCGNTTEFHVHFIYTREKGSCNEVANAQCGGDAVVAKTGDSVGTIEEDAIENVVNFDDDDAENVMPQAKAATGIHVNAEFHLLGEVRVVTAMDHKKRMIKHRHVIDDSDVESISMDLNDAAQKIK